MTKTTFPTLRLLAAADLGAALFAGCSVAGKAEHYVLRSHAQTAAFYTPENGKAGSLEKAHAKGVVAQEKDESLVADWLF